MADRRRLALASLVASLLGAGAGCDACEKRPPAGDPPAADAGPSEASPPAPSASGPVNALPIPTASVAAAVNPDKLPAYDGKTGSVEGTISVVGDDAPETPANFKACPGGEQDYGRAFRVGASTSSGRALADAIVAVIGYEGFYVPARGEAITARIVGCGFEQRTITLTFGQRLELLNRSQDVILPVLEPSPRPVVMAAIPGGDAVKLYLPKPGRYRLTSHQRPWMTADVYAFKHPLHGVTRADGTYRIDHVPVGKLRVGATHPAFEGDAMKEVEIHPNVVARVDLVLTHARREAGAPPADAGPADAGPNRPILR